jgi:predicted nucleic acid-binding protein
MNGIADTGFIVGFANRTDEHHAWALEIAGRISEPLLTCEAVLAEAAIILERFTSSWEWFVMASSLWLSTAKTTCRTSKHWPSDMPTENLTLPIYA